jgi:hypothetical protein
MFHGGVVKENGEFENMTELVETFEGLPTFKDVVDCAMINYGVGMHELTFRGRFDCGKARARYVLMSLSSEENWNRYKKVVGQANVSCLEVVVDITHGPSGNVNMNEEVPFEVQNGTQESTILEEDLGCREPRPEVGVVVNDDFPNDCFEREEETMDDDDISDSSEEGESEDESDEEDVEEQNDANAHAAKALLGLSEVNLDGVQHDDVGGPSVNHTAVEREVHISRPPVNTRNGKSEQHVPRLPDNTRIGESDEHYTQSQYKFGLPSVRNDRDLSRIDRAISDSTMLFT